MSYKLVMLTGYIVIKGVNASSKNLKDVPCACYGRFVSDLSGIIVSIGTKYCRLNEQVLNIGKQI